MKDTEKDLKAKLSIHFAGQSQRLTMLSKLIISMLKLGTINYSKLSIVLNPAVKQLSNFKRIQRFIKQYSFDYQSYIQLVWCLFVEKDNWVALSIDRTNWKFGAIDINILLIGISYRGTAIPLVWALLNKRGNSSGKERINLMDKLLRALTENQKQKIRCILGDREFIGSNWITYLKEQPFSFVIRIRNNSKVRKAGQSKEIPAKQLFGKRVFQAFRKQRILFEHRLYIGGQKTEKGDWLILISDQAIGTARQFYGERWGIEVFFGICKTRGFNFEDTHVTKPKRISNLLFLVAIAYAWALKTGEFLLENGHQIPIKQLKTVRRKLFSIFRIGLDRLKELLLNFLSTHMEIGLLSCT